MLTTILTRTEAVRRACRIDGWLTEQEAAALYDAARAATGPIIEIGSWQGRSTTALALGAAAGTGQQVYAVDPFIGAQQGAFPTALGQRPDQAVTPAGLRANLDAAGVNGQVTIVPRHSHDAAADLPACGLLFVDGAHDYEAVRRDLELYLPKVLPGGTVILHDVHAADPGVVQAVDECLTTNPEWQLRGRVDSAVLADKLSVPTRDVVLLLPGTSWGRGQLEGILQASFRHNVRCLFGGAAGWDGFNALWAAALNAYEAGEATQAAMLHADITPASGWLDILAAEQFRRRCPFVSAVVPIKDRRAVTTTGVGDAHNVWGAWRRFTVREVLDLPESFTVQDTPHPDKYLLVNSGCWLADLGDERFRAADAAGNLRAWFDFPTRIRRNAEGQWAHERESEDWFFSRKLAELGIQAVATRKVWLSHEGKANYTNYEPWGAAHDEDTADNWRSDADAGTA